MKEENEKEYHPGDVIDLYDELAIHSCSLKAFGALLSSSDLSPFADQQLGDTLKSDDFESSSLRAGLNQIITLYLTHQDKLLTKYTNAYHKSEFSLFGHASFIIEEVPKGMYTSREKAISKINEAISELEAVISKEGFLKDNAEKMKVKAEIVLASLVSKAAA